MNTRAKPPGTGLYLLTPDQADGPRLLAVVAPVLATGAVAMLQLRNKRATAPQRRNHALALLPLCRAHGVALIINDDWRLAADIGADGAHLGEHDGSLEEARAALGPAGILGASCYDDLDRAARAAAAGASYLAFGAFFPSGTKPLARRAPLALLAQAHGFGLPTVAIGGITPDNARSLLAAGADFLAVLGAVFDAPDPAAAALAFPPCFATRTA